jgi:tyrosyl-tRNA synthetase
MEKNYQKINKMSRENIQLYFDIVDYPKSYPADWVKEFITLYREEYIEPIIQLYKDMKGV